MSRRGAVLELVEEDLGGGDRAEQVDLDHLPVVVALVGVEGTEQHDAGVVDQDVGAAELVLDALGGGDDAVAVGDVGLDGDGPVAQLVSERGDAVEPAGEERDAVAVGGEGAGGGRPDAGGGAGDDGDASRCGVVRLVRRSGFRDLAAEALEGDGVRLGAAALAGVERVDGGQLVGGELEVEDVEVLGDAVRLGRLRDDRAALLQVPAQHDLGRGLAVRLGDLADDRVLEGAGVLAVAVEGDAADR